MPTVRAGVYVRISRDQLGEGLGVARQEKDCRALAKRRGWSVVEVYSDDDASAYSGRPRPAYRRMLRDVRDGKLDAIVSYRADRLYRRLKDLAELTELVQSRDVKIATVASGDVDLSSADGLMMANVLGSVAQAESHRMSERIRRQRLEAAQAGERNGGRRAFGFDPDNVTHRDAEADAIRAAARQLIGGGSVYRVVRDWNDAGILTPLGNRWRTETVARLMQQPSLAGIRFHEPTGTSSPAVWEPIISEEEHALLKVRLTRPGNDSRPATRRALLSGMIRCASCGAKLLAGGGRYVCDRGRGGGCGETRVAQGRMLEYVVFRIADRARRERRRERPRKRQPASQRRIIRELRAASERGLELDNMLGAGELDRRAYVRASDTNRREIEKLTAELDAGATPDFDAVEMTHDAGMEWLRGDNLTAAEVERLQAPMRALGDWYVSPGERFKRYTADELEERVELRRR